MQAEAIDGLIHEMAQAIKTRLEVQQAKDPVMIGIHTGGVWLAERLHQLLHINRPLGTLDISFYRDDFTRIGPRYRLKLKTNISFWWTMSCKLAEPSVPP